MAKNQENNVESTNNHVDPFATPNRYDTEVEAFVEHTGEKLFKFLVIALAAFLVAAAVYFVLQSIYVLIILVLGLLSLFGVLA